MSDLSGDISAAVDAAVAQHSPSDGPTGDASAQPAEAAAPPAAPPTDSGATESNADDSASAAPATQATEKSAKPEEPVAAPPQEKWPTILENARKKERAAATRELNERYGIPEDADPERVRAHVWGLINDPIGYYKSLGEQLAPYLATNAPAQPTRAFQRPTPRLRSEDGTAAYTAEDVDALVEHVQSEMTAEFNRQLAERLGPLQQTHEELESQKRWGTAVERAKTQLEEASSWEAFDELKEQIRDLMETDKRVTLWSAYNRLHQTWAKDRSKRIEQETRQRVLDEIKKAPAAPTKTVAPGQPVRAGSVKRSRSLDADIDRAIESAYAKAGGA